MTSEMFYYTLQLNDVQLQGVFMKSKVTKEKIITQTIELIQESNGLTENITIRKIAEKANVSVGLINHYFGAEDHWRGNKRFPPGTFR